ncbi:ABC-three component system middle component 7 [Treponema denticola]|uniref:ABC-three component system middle component 7 n=1 Tax=Treponema denticola TaxID=158 RepID=UPI0034E58906
MKLPNKLFTTTESCIGKFPIILEITKKASVSVYSLYTMTKKYFLSITDFIDTLDALFYLGKITFEEDSIIYVN